MKFILITEINYIDKQYVYTYEYVNPENHKNFIIDTVSDNELRPWLGNLSNGKKIFRPDASINNTIRQQILKDYGGISYILHNHGLIPKSDLKSDVEDIILIGTIGSILGGGAVFIFKDQINKLKTWVRERFTCCCGESPSQIKRRAKIEKLKFKVKSIMEQNSVLRRAIEDDNMELRSPESERIRAQIVARIADSELKIETNNVKITDYQRKIMETKGEPVSSSAVAERTALLSQPDSSIRPEKGSSGIPLDQLSTKSEPLRSLKEDTELLGQLASKVSSVIPLDTMSGKLSTLGIKENSYIQFDSGEIFQCQKGELIKITDVKNIPTEVKITTPQFRILEIVK